MRYYRWAQNHHHILGIACWNYNVDILYYIDVKKNDSDDLYGNAWY